MRKDQIFVGKTYRNRGAGRTKRLVLEISRDLEAPRFSSNPPPDEPKVKYRQNGLDRVLFLGSFAQWAGEEDKAVND